MKYRFCKENVYDRNNCHLLNVGNSGYFFEKIPSDLTVPKGKDVHFLDSIDRTCTSCFGFNPLYKSNNLVFTPYFLKADNVVLESEYRVCRDWREFCSLIDPAVINGDIKPSELAIGGEIGVTFMYRRNNVDECVVAQVTEIRIRKNKDATVDTFINGFSLDTWFKCYEIFLNGEWQPFGIEF